MAEIHAPENQLNGVVVGGGPLVVSTSETVGSKRQRRPSVRLGDIGDQPYDSHVRRTTNKQWKNYHHQQQQQHQHHNQNHNHNNHNQQLTNATSKPSKTKPLTNLATSTATAAAAGDFNETLDEDKDGNNLDTVAIGSWRVKDSKKRGSSAKRVRSSWVTKIDETPGNNNNGDKEDKFSGGGGGGDEDIENESYRDFDIENSESPLKEQSPIHSLEENLGGDGNERELLYRRSIRGSHHDGVELSGPSDNGGGGGGGEDGVRIWLNSLGLGRYAPVFEIHEVDDEVLPMLTLEDLKDMGINAVGSRRKMFCAIQKLGKGFS